MFRYAPLKKIQSWSNWMTDDLIIKSATRMFMDEDGNLHYVRGELPEEGYNLKDENGEEIHAPPTAFDPRTGELSLDGHLHPMDYLIQEMLKLSQMNQSTIGSDEVKRHITEMIGRHNNALLAKHFPDAVSADNRTKSKMANKISNILQVPDHPEWRRNISTNHGDVKIKDIDPDKHQYRTEHEENGNHGEKINYLHKKGHSKHAEADKGEYIDAALGFAFRKYIPSVLDRINQEEVAAGNPAPYFGWKQSPLDYLSENSTISLRRLSGNRQFTVGTNDFQEYRDNHGRLPPRLAEKLGTTQDNMPAKQVRGHVNQLMHVNALPKWAYRPLSKGGLNPKEDKMSSILSQMRAFFQRHNHEFADWGDEDYKSLLKIPALKNLFTRRSRDLRDTGTSKHATSMVINSGVPEEDAHRIMPQRKMDTDGYVADTHGDRAKTKNTVAAHLHSARDSIAQYLMETEGLPMKEARLLANQRMYESDSPHPPAGPKLTEEFDQMGGIEPISESIEKLLRETAMSSGEPMHNDEFQIIQDYSPKHPGYSTGQRMTGQTKGRLSMRPPAISSLSSTGASPITSPPQTTTPVDATAAPPAELPGKNIPLKYDLEGNVIKALEHMQLKRARNNTELLKSLPNYAMDISSMNDVRSFSQQFGMLPQDIHAITSSRGDWAKIAKQWHLPLRNIELVKLAFGGI